MRGFEPSEHVGTEGRNRLQWVPAIGAGFIAGAVLLIVPRGSPWSALTFFSPVILGRTLPPAAEMPLLLVWAIHLALSVIYGLIISRSIASLTHQYAFLVGGIMGLILYALNFAVVHLWLPALAGNEFGVLFTHLVFGLIAAGAYRGLLRRRAVPVRTAS